MIATKTHTGQPTSLPAGTLRIPEPTAIELVSSRGAIDQAVAELHAAKDIWAQTDVAGKAAILDAVHRDLMLVGTQWVNASLQAKQVPAGGFAEEEE